LIDRLISERAAREAERGMDKQIEGAPPPGAITIKHLIGHLVRLKIGDPLIKGLVFGFDVRQTGTTYHVCWGDNRQSSEHYDFELEAVEAD
jgi:hypothetical protein